MSITTVQLWQRLTDNGLATPLQCRQWAVALAEEQGAAAMGSVDAVARFLVQQNVVSQYQAKQLIDEPEPTLRIGSWQVLQPCQSGPLGEWFEARKWSAPSSTTTSGSDSASANSGVQGSGTTADAADLLTPHAWIRKFTAEELGSQPFRSAGPSLSRLDRFSRLHDSGLIPVDQLEWSSGELIVALKAIPGKPLSRYQNKLPIPPSIATDWIEKLATGLQALHAAGMVAGRLSPDRIWVTPERQLLWLVDPLLTPVTPSTSQPASLFADELPKGHWAETYAAPEFIVPGQQPNVRTDLYALGAIWYWLLTGKPLFNGSEPGQLSAAHLQSPIPELPTGGDFSAPLLKSLQHLLAKNPASRFESAAAFCRTLQQILAPEPVEVAVSPVVTEVVPPPQAILPQQAETAPVVEPTMSQQPSKSKETPRRQDSPVSIAAAKTVEPPKARANVDVKSPALATKPDLTQPPSKTTTPPAAIISPKAIEPVAVEVVEKPETQPKSTSQPSTVKLKEGSSKEVLPKEVLPKEVLPKEVLPKEVLPKEVLPKAAALHSAPKESPSAPLEQKAIAEKPAAAKPAAIAPTLAEPVELLTPPKKQSGETTDASAAESSVADEPEVIAPVSVSPQSAPVTNEPAATAEDTAPEATTDTATASEAEAIRSEKVLESSPKTGSAKSTKVSADKSSKPSATKSKKPRGTATSAVGSRTQTVRRKKASASSRPKWLVPAVGGGGFLLIVGLLIALAGPSGTKKNPQPDVADSASSGAATDSQSSITASKAATEPIKKDPVREVFTVVSDNNTVPWAPPNAGSPIALSLLPPEAQIILAVRPSTFIEDPQGKELIQLLGPPFDQVWLNLQTLTGLPPGEIESAVVGMYPAAGGWPEYAARVRLKSARTLSDLKQVWGNPTASGDGEGDKLLVGANDKAYYVADQPLVDAQSVTEFAVGPQNRMLEAVALEGGRPPMRRQMEQVWRASDSTADLTLIFAPNFLFAEGREILPAYAPRIRPSLQQLLGEQMQAGMLTATLKPQWYTELRLIGPTSQDAGLISQSLQKMLSETPDLVEQSLVSQPAHPYWRAVANRFPQMLRSVNEYSRVSVEDGQAIANMYLPTAAAPNLLLASWYAIQGATGDAAADSSAMATNSTKPLNIIEVLDRPISLTFDQEAIEVAIQLIADETKSNLPAGTPEVIMFLDGSALEKEGITRNQQIRDFVFKGVPLRNVLTDLCKRGNPEKTDQQNSEAQKLVWAVVEDPSSPSGEAIHVTTRAFCDSNKIPLPPEFAIPSN